ncbi:AraC family transcriptional regulator [Zavarzinia compransoris]|uniref:helix-turn-helix transcriptional regulator n=1 Tax=Zavarzinia marina TaxID=2911065 RepID=UPI001F289279|nr:AraC family transcriptional regulator [Zavarzinia marina]MCF4166528.1 AraC family transcriptional regulator [Zavarzinia marina]
MLAERLLAERLLADRLLADRLLAGLASFRRDHTAGTVPHGENLFSYCALARERLAAIRLDLPVLGVVLSGAKEIWRGDAATVLREGSAFVLPAKIAMDVLNLPSERNGVYQSLIVEVAPDALPDGSEGARTAWARASGARASGARAVGAGAPVELCLTPHLVDTLIHAASKIAAGPAGPTVRRSRLAEVLALLEADPAARPLFDRSVGERVVQLVRGDLAAPWTAPLVARALAMSESTLRRRLSEEGLAFGDLLRRERMRSARDLLASGASAERAATAVGYLSRGHFTRHFRDAFGLTPGRARARAQPFR